MVKVLDELKQTNVCTCKKKRKQANSSYFILISSNIACSEGKCTYKLICIYII